MNDYIVQFFYHFLPAQCFVCLNVLFLPVPRALPEKHQLAQLKLIFFLFFSLRAQVFYMVDPFFRSVFSLIKKDLFLTQAKARTWPSAGWNESSQINYGKRIKREGGEMERGGVLWRNRWRWRQNQWRVENKYVCLVMFSAWQILYYIWMWCYTSTMRNVLAMNCTSHHLGIWKQRGRVNR